MKISSDEMQKIKEANTNRLVQLPDGTWLPRLGQGTWFIGDKPAKRGQEIETLKLGVELGMNLIDTAEMYGEGKSESLVGEAIKGLREQVFLVSKVYPHNSGLGRIVKSCENSLRRLQTDHLDLYLLHWRGGVPLEEVAEGMEKLIRDGKIARWGVSNLDTEDMDELVNRAHGTSCMVNEVLYHLGSRGIEYDLLPWQRARKIPVLAYSPLAQAGSLRRGLVENSVVREIAENHAVKPMQILLAWTIREDGVIAIPKASTEQHVLENAKAAFIVLSADDLTRLNEVFPAPTRKVPLDVI